MKTPVTNITIRFPDDLHKAIRQEAETQERTLSKQVIHILREWLKSVRK